MKNFLKIAPLLLMLTSCGIWTAKNSTKTSVIHQSIKQCALVDKECAKNCMLYGNSESDCDEYCCLSSLKKTSAPTKNIK